MLEAENDLAGQPKGPFLKRIGSFSYGAFLAIVIICFSYVYLRNAWVGDDAYITFRTIDNLLAGHGLTWNVDERVQVFTHPLWMLLMVLLRWVTGEFYYTVLALSFVFTLGALILAINLFRSHLPKALLLFLISYHQTRLLITRRQVWRIRSRICLSWSCMLPLLREASRKKLPGRRSCILH